MVKLLLFYLVELGVLMSINVKTILTMAVLVSATTYGVAGCATSTSESPSPKSDLANSQVNGPANGAGAQTSSPLPPQADKEAPEPPNPDTETLRKLEGRPDMPLVNAISLRGGTIALKPMAEDPKSTSDLISGAKAQSMTRQQHYVPADTAITCRSGVLTNTDIFRPEGGGKDLLFEDRQVWTCFSVDVPSVGSMGSAAFHLVATYLDARTGVELFTTDDSA